MPRDPPVFAVTPFFGTECLGGNSSTWQPCVSETTCNLRYVGMLGEFLLNVFYGID